jgi:AraC-like DNA-binding protein
MKPRKPVPLPAHFETTDAYDVTVGRISFVRRREADAAWALSDHGYRRDHILAWCTSGKAHYRFGDDRRQVGRHTLLYFPAGSRHSARADADEPWAFYSLAFELQWPEPDVAQALGELPWHVRPENPLAIDTRLADLERVWISRPPGYLLQCRAVISSLLHTFISSVSRGRRSSSHARRIQRILDILHGDLGRNYSIDELSELAGLSPSRFRAVFKEVTGHSAVRYQNWLRINRAKDLLLSGDCTVTQAAREVGFEDVYYFSRLFKKMTGANPSDYRKA